MRGRHKSVPQHDLFHFCRVRRAARHERRHLAKIAGSEDAGGQDAETARRFLRVVAERMDDPALDEDGLTRLERNVLRPSTRQVDTPMSPTIVSSQFS